MPRILRVIDALKFVAKNLGRSLKYLTFSFGLFAFATLAYCVATFDIDKFDFDTDPEPSRDIVSIRITGTEETLRIPRNYLDWPRPYGSSAEGRGVLMFVTMPEVEGFTKENRHRSRESGQWGAILITNSPVSLRRSYEIYTYPEERILQKEVIETEYDLQKTIIVPKPNTVILRLPYAIYERFDTNDDVFAYCIHNTVGNGGICSVYYYWHNLEIKFSLPDKHMPEWKSVRRRIDDLLEGKIVNPTIKEDKTDERSQ